MAGSGKKRLPYQITLSGFVAVSVAFIISLCLPGRRPPGNRGRDRQGIQARTLSRMTICDFGLVVSGQTGDLKRFKSAFENNCEQLVGKRAFTGYFLVRLDHGTWGELKMHQFVWADPNHPRRLATGTAVGTPTYFKDETTLAVDGTSKWGPPVEFIGRASAVYPALAFDLRGWTENARYEHWTAEHGLLHLVDQKLANPQSKKVIH
jgi:hypothetical protein